MTKEELESKFEDCFDDNTRSSEGGYGPDVTDKGGLWRSFEIVISEYAKQQAIAFSVFKDKFRREESKRVREEEKRLGGMITWIGRSDEEIYNQFVE